MKRRRTWKRGGSGEQRRAEDGTRTRDVQLRKTLLVRCRTTTEQGAPGKPRPAVFALARPRPPLLKGFTKERLGSSSQTQNPLMATSWPPPERSLPMFSSEPAPSSPRPWASARVRPLADESTLTRTLHRFDRKGIFLFCLDNPMKACVQRTGCATIAETTGGGRVGIHGSEAESQDSNSGSLHARRQFAVQVFTDQFVDRRIR